MVSKLKRWLYLTHRWMGVALCLFLAMWFFSGVVMMYVGYPKLTMHERLSHLPSISAANLLSPAEAFSRAGATGPLQELSLSASRAGRPVYQALFENGKRLVVDALDGSLPPATNPATALSSAQAFVGPGLPLTHEGLIQEDAFTHSRALDQHRPLHRIAVANNAGTRLYVSGSTGEVVRDSSRLERGWNYVGAWIHWLYPFRGNIFNSHWANIVNWLSIIGIALTITGTVVGLLRWRFTRPYRRGSRSPYSGKMMRWHHKTGLVFALITLSWLFSGLISMGPWGFLRTPSPTQHLTRMHGSSLLVEDLSTKPASLLTNAKDVREVRWTKRLNQEIALLYHDSGKPDMVSAANGAAVQFSEAEIAAAASRLFDVPLQRTVLLDQYDFYYYDRAPHTMTGGRNKPLPVIRAIYDDPGRTWVHIDARTAQVLNTSNANSRLRRWLFQMLHSWDWLPLLERRPLWDLVMVLLSLGGFAISMTGVVIGVRRLRLRIRSFTRRSASRHPRPGTN